MALFRILFGMLMIQFCVLIQPDLFTWFGSRGIVSSGAVHSFSLFVELNILNVFPDNDTWLSILFFIFFLGTISLTLGYRTRISATVVFLGICSLYHRDPLLFNAGDTFMRQVALWLPFSSAGDAYSIDQALRNKRAGKPWYAEGEPSSPWVLRVLQIQLCLVYAHTFYGKTQGYTWTDGTAVYYSSRLVELRRFVVPYIFDHEWTVHMFTYGTLLIEFSLAVLVWIKPLRYWVLAAGLCFHMMIDLNMSIPQFEWLMMVSFSLFLYPEDLRKWIHHVANIIYWRFQPDARQTPLP